MPGTQPRRWGRPGSRPDSEAALVQRDDLVPAGILGQVHGPVGTGHQRVDVIARFHHGHADADGCGRLLTIDEQRFGNRPADLLGHRSRCVEVLHASQDQKDLVATDPCHRVT